MHAPVGCFNEVQSDLDQGSRVRNAEQDAAMIAGSYDHV